MRLREASASDLPIREMARRLRWLQEPRDWQPVPEAALSTFLLTNDAMRRSRVPTHWMAWRISGGRARRFRNL